MEIAKYDYKYLTSSEAKMVHLLEKFNIMKSRVVINRCQEGDNSLNEYLSKIGHCYTFIGIFWQCVTLFIVL